MTGTNVPLSKIEAAREAILNLYRGNGFILTAVSAVLDTKNILHFVVTEGRIAEVKLEGDIGPAGAIVLRFLRHLTEQQPIDAATLERWLLLAREVPGVAVNAVLRPSTDEPGALVLVAQVKRKPFSGLFTADNAAFPLTGPAEALLVLDANSFTRFGEQTQVSLYHTSGNTQNFGQASVQAFVGDSGLAMRVYGGAGPTNPSGDLRAIGYHGTTSVFGAAATYPALRRRNQTLTLTASVDAIDEIIRTESAPGGLSLLSSQDAVRAFRTDLDYALHDLLLGDDREAINTVNVRLSQGIPGLGASSGQGADVARLGEVPGFTKIDASLGRTQTVYQPWENASIALAGLLSGQWSADILPPVEKFYLGGLQLNPGYYSGQVTGDKALAALAELRLNTSYDCALFGYRSDVDAQFFGFGSWGESWENQRLDPDRRVASAGGGVRLFFGPQLEFDVIGVSRLVLKPSGGGANVASLPADAAYWRVIMRF